jgi:hypothetical protein
VHFDVDTGLLSSSGASLVERVMLSTETDMLAELEHQRRTVDTDYFDLSLRELARMVTEGEIRIAPAYQRQFRWKDDTQSALIESFLLCLTVPALFVSTNRD